MRSGRVGPGADPAQSRGFQGFPAPGAGRARRANQAPRLLLHEDMEPRVILYEAAANGEPSLMPLLPACGCQAVATSTAEALMDAVTRDPQQVVLFALDSGRPDDLVTLRVLRRVAPELPLVIVATAASLEVRRLIQTLRPVYFAVRPVDAEEMHDALCAACPEPRKQSGEGARGERTSKSAHRPGPAPA